MSAFDTKCAWLPCRKQLGVYVWRLSKFGTQQFCCETCAQKWADMQARNKAAATFFNRTGQKEGANA